MSYEYHSKPHDFNDNDIDVVIRRMEGWKWQCLVKRNGEIIFNECTVRSSTELKKEIAKRFGLHPDTKYKRVLVR